MTKESDAGIVEDLGADVESERFKPEITTIILGILLLIISNLFLYLLSYKTGADFGLSEIILSATISVIAALFLTWIKFFMAKNPYLGLIIGLVLLSASIYSLRLKFKGPYTNTFSIMISVVVLIYLFIHFWKSKKKNNL